MPAPSQVLTRGHPSLDLVTFNLNEDPFEVSQHHEIRPLLSVETCFSHSPGGHKFAERTGVHREDRSLRAPLCAVTDVYTRAALSSQKPLGFRYPRGCRWDICSYKLNSQRISSSVSPPAPDNPYAQMDEQPVIALLG
ncbi:unnamed protein product [Pleuronectes platessa]|uniref:Uncharacterized protein n=1 Tax=Pleuronectes platessa TaxID=8262 RepID=A0A9N7TVH2_PLEPL|nr:unnamed protein product [Pleuronectes platessa]